MASTTDLLLGLGAAALGALLFVGYRKEEANDQARLTRLREAYQSRIDALSGEVTQLQNQQRSAAETSRKVSQQSSDPWPWPDDPPTSGGNPNASPSATADPSDLQTSADTEISKRLTEDLSGPGGFSSTVDESVMGGGNPTYSFKGETFTSLGAYQDALAAEVRGGGGGATFDAPDGVNSRVGGYGGTGRIV